MRTTINLNEALLERAQALTGVQERSALLREALTALIQRESARSLVHLGGSQPDLSAIPRHRNATNRDPAVSATSTRICLPSPYLPKARSYGRETSGSTSSRSGLD